MKNIFFLSLILIAQSALAQKGFEFTFKLKGAENQPVYLGFHLGDKQYIKDTVIADGKGKAVFSGKEKLDGGIYLLVTQSKKYFEFLVDRDDQQYTIENDINDMVGAAQSKQSLNQDFFEYQRIVTGFNKKADPLVKEMEKIKDDDSQSKRQEELRVLLKSMDTEIKAFKNEKIKKNPDALLSSILLINKEVEIPESPKLPNGTIDSSFSFRYYNKHYFDYINLNDERLIRTPIYGPRILNYFEKQLYPISDSIIPALDLFISKLQNKTTYKYLVQILTNHYEGSKIMGMDAVTLHLYKTQYLSGKAYWADSTTLAKIKDRVKKQEPLLIGKVAPNLVLKDTLGIYRDMHRLPDPYILLIFWDPDCGHCKKELPKLKELYPKLRAKGIEVYTATPEPDKELWLKGLHNLKIPGIHVADIDLQNYFRTIYDITHTPQIYFLDQNRVIRGKQLSLEHLDIYLKNIMHIEL